MFKVGEWVIAREEEILNFKKYHYGAPNLLDGVLNDLKEPIQVIPNTQEDPGWINAKKIDGTEVLRMTEKYRKATENEIKKNKIKYIFDNKN